MLRVRKGKEVKKKKEGVLVTMWKGNGVDLNWVGNHIKYIKESVVAAAVSREEALYYLTADLQTHILFKIVWEIGRDQEKNNRKKKMIKQWELRWLSPLRGKESEGEMGRYVVYVSEIKGTKKGKLKLEK